MRRSLIASCASAALLLSACGNSPETAITEPVDALKRNELQAVLPVFPKQSQRVLSEAWSSMMVNERAMAMSGQIDRVLALLRDEESSSLIVSNVRAYVAANPSFLADRADRLRSLQGQAFLDDLRERGVQLDGLAPEKVEELLGNIATWLEGVDVTDEAHMEQALSLLREGLIASRIETFEDVRRLDLPTFLERVNPLFANLKEAGAMYGLDIDGALESISVAVVDDSGIDAQVQITMNAFDTDLTLPPISVTKVNGEWRIKQPTVTLAQ